MMPNWYKINFHLRQDEPQYIRSINTIWSTAAPYGDHADHTHEKELLATRRIRICEY